MKNKVIRISDEFTGEGEKLLHCPRCDGSYTHQGEVNVFERGEDADDGTHVRVLDNDVKIDRNLTDNPSRRRHGLTIAFDCESCEGGFLLDIYQHKGNTFISARLSEE
ncbi:hypothetical protein [Ruegeria atlantica]|uniref:hypothetical protein n=1 Tax=Ruegeria atlantica TaxID=81569 RepID=UPI00147A033E|nr:hypothetical protein [Ruegeria atlantica]